MTDISRITRQLKGVTVTINQADRAFELWFSDQDFMYKRIPFSMWISDALREARDEAQRTGCTVIDYTRYVLVDDNL